MAASADIGAAGERLVADWLRARNFLASVNTKGPGSTDIEAVGSRKAFLFQVKTAVWPSVPDTLSSSEESNIKPRARRLGYEPWEPRVQLTAQLQPMEEIQCRKLV